MYAEIKIVNFDPKGVVSRYPKIESCLLFLDLRSSDLTLICDPSASTPSFQPLGEQGTGIYVSTYARKI